MTNNSSGLVSSYNEGMLQIERLHYLWAQANNQSRRGLYKEWRWTLDTIWRELSRDAIKKEWGRVVAGDFADSLSKNKWFLDRESIEKEIVKARDTGDLQKYYEALSRMEIFLRVLQDAVGKGGKYKDEHEDEME